MWDKRTREDGGTLLHNEREGDKEASRSPPGRIYTVCVDFLPVGLSHPQIPNVVLPLSC